jgi:hypothetical protein
MMRTTVVALILLFMTTTPVCAQDATGSPLPSVALPPAIELLGAQADVGGHP